MPYPTSVHPSSQQLSLLTNRSLLRARSNIRFSEPSFAGQVVAKFGVHGVHGGVRFDEFLLWLGNAENQHDLCPGFLLEHDRDLAAILCLSRCEYDDAPALCSIHYFAPPPVLVSMDGSRAHRLRP